ncbi:MAG: hypothetical protein HQK76_07255 [Desulfobacterales bacterium]|nr:hypothetical protein [Desulfobacterales bacterium]
MYLIMKDKQIPKKNMEKAIKYKKLPGRSRGLVSGIHELWYCEDHMIYVISHNVSEDYKRFYYSDIQSFIIRKTITGIIFNVILILSVLCFLYIFYISSMLDSWISWVVIGLFALNFFRSLYLGYSCNFYIMTAVQLRRIKSINRSKKVDSFLKKIMPLVTNAQKKTEIQPKV